MDQINTSDLSLVAAEDLDSYQYCIVALNASGNMILSDNGEDVVIDVGILQDKPKDTEAGEVRHACGKVSKIVYGDEVSIGDKLKSNASNGRAVPVSTAARYLGIALVSGSNGTVGSILLEPGYYAAS